MQIYIVGREEGRKEGKILKVASNFLKIEYFCTTLSLYFNEFRAFVRMSKVLCVLKSGEIGALTDEFQNHNSDFRISCSSFAICTGEYPFYFKVVQNRTKFQKHYRGRTVFEKLGTTFPISARKFPNKTNGMKRRFKARQSKPMNQKQAKQSKAI